MHTLKVQLGLTLSVLLFLSMLLFGMVILTLWQRNIIQHEKESSQRLLHIVSLSLMKSENGTKASLPLAAKTFINESNILCLQYQTNSTAPPVSYGLCPAELSLAVLAEKAIASNSLQTNYSGMIWNGFFFTKKYLLIAQPLQQSEQATQKTGSIGLVHSLQKKLCHNS